VDQKKLEELTDEELLEEAKKNKQNPKFNAMFIGFLFGIIIYSVIVNSVGFFTLIPMFIIYIFVNKSKKDKEIKKLLKERNLK
jgi:hypothetical protein